MFSFGGIYSSLDIKWCCRYILLELEQWVTALVGEKNDAQVVNIEFAKAFDSLKHRLLCTSILPLKSEAS